MERIANAAEPPRWYQGDYFGDLFAPVGAESGGTGRCKRDASAKWGPRPVVRSPFSGTSAL